jgi:ComF family protein
MVNNGLKSIQWLFSGSCLLCAAPVSAHQDFCPACELALPWLAAVCARCGAPTRAATADTECGACQKRPPAFHATRALFHYAAPVDGLIHGLKYHGRLEQARVLGMLFADRLTRTPDDSVPDLILPVPLHPSRLRRRGYNQSLELARPIARRLNVPLDILGVRRIRATPPQTDLPKQARRANVRNAFRATREYRNLHIAIVDDVMTSGHTADALARCLMKAGAKKVSVWVVARA